MTTVGTKYQLVIDRRARAVLGIAPGWQALERVVDGHLEVYFLPPDHHESLAGSLNAYGRTSALEPAEQESQAWVAHVNERWGAPVRSGTVQ